MLTLIRRTLLCMAFAGLMMPARPVFAQTFSPTGTFEGRQDQISISDQYIVFTRLDSSFVGLEVYDRGTLALIRSANLNTSLFGIPLSADLQGDRVLIGDYGNAEVLIYSISQDQALQSLVGPAGFGRAVAASDTRVLVGADDSGVAQLFLNNGQLIRTIPAEHFHDRSLVTGKDIAIGDQYGLIGQREPNQPGHVIVIDPHNGDIVRTLQPDGCTLQFGRGTAVYGSTAVVGDSGYRPSEDSALQGGAYVFDLSTGSPLFILRPPYPDSTSLPNLAFGRTVAINDKYILVGAYNRAGDFSPQAGAVYAYRRSDGMYLGRLMQSSVTANGRFGWVIGLSRDLVFVGSPFYSKVDWYTLVAAEISRQPESQVAVPGASVVMQVEVLDDRDVQFQWRRQEQPIVDGPNFQGATTATLTITATPDATGFYDCVITRDQMVPVTSARVVLGVLPDPNACYADANNDGQLNFFDIARYIQLFNAGCP